MNQTKQTPTNSIINWLGAALLALLIVGLVYVTMNSQSPSEPEETVIHVSPVTNPSSPLPATMSSPLSSPLPVILNSPLPANPPTLVHPPTPTPSPPPPPASTEQAPTLQLTVLHSNDTWGYLLPCG